MEWDLFCFFAGGGANRKVRGSRYLEVSRDPGGDWGGSSNSLFPSLIAQPGPVGTHHRTKQRSCLLAWCGGVCCRVFMLSVFVSVVNSSQMSLVGLYPISCKWDYDAAKTARCQSFFHVPF